MKMRPIPMSMQAFRLSLLLLATAFTAAFVMVCIPPFLEKPDIIGAFAGGFVNPYASGYSMDILFTWSILASWVLYEAKTMGIRHGWVSLVLGIVPGVAVGFAFYLMLRLQHQRVND